MVLLFKFKYWKKCYIWKRLKMFPILKQSIDEEHIDKNIKFVELLIGKVNHVRIM